MPRRREVPKREILPDPKYGNQDLSKFVNVLMTAGKKSVAERILYGALEQVAKKSGKDPIEVFNLALDQCQAAGRSEEPPCRRCQLSGSGRSASFPPYGAGDALVEVKLRASAAKNPWVCVWPVS